MVRRFKFTSIYNVMPKIIVIRGGICTGKTTTASLLREHLSDYSFIEPDTLKQMADDTASSLWRRRLVENVTVFFLTALMQRRRNIIVTLHAHDLLMYSRVQALALTCHYSFFSFLLTAPSATCLARNKQRGVPGMRYAISKRKIIQLMRKVKTVQYEHVFDTATQSTKEIVRAMLSLLQIGKRVERET